MKAGKKMKDIFARTIIEENIFKNAEKEMKQCKKCKALTQLATPKKGK